MFSNPHYPRRRSTLTPTPGTPRRKTEVKAFILNHRPRLLGEGRERELPFSPVKQGLDKRFTRGLVLSLAASSKDRLSSSLRLSGASLSFMADIKQGFLRVV